MNEQLFDSLVEKIHNKLIANDNAIQLLKNDLVQCQTQISQFSETLNKSIDDNKKEIQRLFDQMQPNLQAIPEVKNTPVPEQSPVPVDTSASEISLGVDLTKLVAYRQAAMFGEIKRPTNINELYMMVIQSQHLLYDLKMHTDNISRRS